MSLFTRFLTRVGLLCLGLTPTIVLSLDAAEVPQGYEDAAMANEAAPAAKAEAEQGGSSLLEALAEALTESVDPQVAALERQFLPQFQPLFKAEQAFVQRACGLNKEQRAQIEAAGEEGLKAVARKYALAQNQRGNGRGVRIVGGTSIVPDPRGLVEQQMARVVQSKLRPEQAEQYRLECDKRAANRKQMTVRNLVALLDERLVLTAEQRDKLVESLTANWQDAWGQSIQLLLHGNQYLPSIPDQQIVPFLNETQKTAWRSIPKQGSVIVTDFGLAPMMVTIDDAVLAEDAKGAEHD